MTVPGENFGVVEVMLWLSVLFCHVRKSHQSPSNVAKLEDLSWFFDNILTSKSEFIVMSLGMKFNSWFRFQNTVTITSSAEYPVLSVFCLRGTNLLMFFFSPAHSDEPMYILCCVNRTIFLLTLLLLDYGNY